MRRYPIFFGFSEMVLCRGFVAGVTVSGRAMAEAGDGGWWIYGVNPGALACGGPSLTEAISGFRAAFRTVLIDEAEEFAEFEQFKGAVEAFFQRCDAETEQEWNAARAEIRAGAGSAGLMSDLPKDTSDRRPEIRVEMLRLAPSQNLVAGSDPHERPAIAA